MPFDSRYWVFKRAYRAYAPVRQGKKLYKVFAEEFLCVYKRACEGKIKSYSGEYATANRLCNIIENHRATVERYFSGRFTYSDYLNMMSEYDLFQEQVVEAKQEDAPEENIKFQRNITLRKKVLIFESLFRVCNVDASNAQKARFIRDLLEVEPNTKEIANTNTYKVLKNNRKELLAKGEITARIKDYEYVAEQLEQLGLEKERTLILSEIKELRNSIDE
ncbi:hypothetical protein BN938_2426 [Mucinivorans hirudinis]|uniref:Uncharacterized protein n=1 Tax=Mucinivorans hirudinis TaxID=1433126 RepID=A0A060RA39_9BACT|nr:hypothetical protein BN938_2426 [Mucinivorans hirudinis]